MFKLSSGNPEFPVQLERRQILDEPVRNSKGIALTGQETAAVPVGAHTIELFAHQPAIDNHTRPVFGQQQQFGSRCRGNQQQQQKQPMQTISFRFHHSLLRVNSCPRSLSNLTLIYRGKARQAYMSGKSSTFPPMLCYK
ncbi:hypothetical protein [Thiolapillus sp.]|uniref:hypothetical protein n=1 Tax=Thiolapillus sp. TaxID=2017437 RepID=UPI003AF849F4